MQRAHVHSVFAVFKKNNQKLFPCTGITKNRDNIFNYFRIETLAETWETVIVVYYCYEALDPVIFYG